MLLQHTLVERQRLGMVAFLLGEARFAQQRERFVRRLRQELVVERSSFVFAPLTRQELRILAHELGLLRELLQKPPVFLVGKVRIAVALVDAGDLQNRARVIRQIACPIAQKWEDFGLLLLREQHL
jgi:hypothetical protein